MNERTTYELTIAEKLAHLSLPDMEDAIWARVKAQLDLDLPADDSNDDGDAPDAPSGNRWMWWGAGSFLFVAAFVSVFLFTKKTNNHRPPHLPPQTFQNTNLPATIHEPVDALPAPAQHQKDGAAPVIAPGTAPPGPLVKIKDSVSGLPTVRVPLPDSGQRTAVVLPPPAVQDSFATKKKTRGVTGITDDDYRIVPAKKDSL